MISVYSQNALKNKELHENAGKQDRFNLQWWKNSKKKKIDSIEYLGVISYKNFSLTNM